MVINNDYNKIQINRTLDKDAQGNVIRQSLMINIRCNDVEESIKLYEELKNRLNGNPTTAQITNNKTNENVPVCDKCGKQMILRKNKKGESFYGCDFPTCRFTLPYETNLDQKEIPNVKANEMPF